jgi:hypothetical protein
MERTGARTFAGYAGMLLIAAGFLLGFADWPILGWIVVGLGSLLVSYSLYTGSQPFIAI